jgi:hypothetical protein
MHALRLAGSAGPTALAPPSGARLRPKGWSANVHAAATDVEIWGTDFNSSHAAHARTLATEAETGAILLDDSFAELLDRRDLPQV